MIERIAHIMNNMPAGGMALHGTSYKKALSIAEKGLERNGYLCNIPNPKHEYFQMDWDSRRFCGGRRLPPFDESTFFSRAIGSILFSTGYSFASRHEKSASNPNGEPAPEQAIVIFANWSDNIHFNLLGDDTDRQFFRLIPSLESRYYQSFGKITCRAIIEAAPDKVCAIARLSRSEMADIDAEAAARAEGDPDIRQMISVRMRENVLILKTFKLIERLTYFEKKPSEILIL